MIKPGNRNKVLADELQFLVKCNDRMQMKSTFGVALPEAGRHRGRSLCFRWTRRRWAAQTGLGELCRVAPLINLTDQRNGEHTVTIKNSIPPGVNLDQRNRLFGNTIRSAEGRELVDRLNAMFERANSTGQVVNQRELSTVLSVRRSEGSPGDRSIPAPDRLMRATEGLSYESLSLLICAAEHLLRSEGVHVDSTPFT